MIMKKINVYTAKAGQGKSFVMMIDAVKMASEGKKVAFITAELSSRFVIKRMNHIAKHFGLKGKISKGNLVVLEVVYDEEKETLKKIEKIKTEFDVLFLDSFHAVHSFGHPTEKPIYKRTEEAYVKLVDLMDSEDSTLDSINTTVSCYSTVDSSVAFMGSRNLIEGLDDKVVLKAYASRNHLGDNSIITVCDFENNNIKEYNLTEIMK